MKEIAETYRPFSDKYIFPCSCQKSKNLEHFKQQECDSQISASILKELKSQCAAYFDMLCIVTVDEQEGRKKISWKPLRENTWNRNHQPKCDNIRITAVSNAFVTIAETAWGYVELHVKGPDVIPTKPYGRLGVGINMLSKHDWKPGFLFMTTPNDKLEQSLRLELRYPVEFQGKISIQWPKRNSDAPADIVFDIDTTKRNIDDLRYRHNGDIQVDECERIFQDWLETDVSTNTESVNDITPFNHSLNLPNLQHSSWSGNPPTTFDGPMIDPTISDPSLNLDWIDISHLCTDNNSAMWFPNHPTNSTNPHINGVNPHFNSLNPYPNSYQATMPWDVNPNSSKNFKHSKVFPSHSKVFPSPSIPMSCENVPTGYFGVHANVRCPHCQKDSKFVVGSQRYVDESMFGIQDR